jgi:ABC-2 type transport system permease protein
VLVFALASGVRPMLTWLEIPLILALLVIFATGLSLLLSSLYVYFRDAAPIWEVVSQILFYCSPVIVPLTLVQQKLSPTLVKVYMLNPLATIFQQFRHAVINHAAPSAGAILGTGGVLVVVAIVFAVFALGFVVFNRTAPYVAENL